MTKIFTKIAVYVFEVILSIERSYKQIFKGGVALLTVYLIGISQIIPTFLDHEYEAKKLQYEFEAVSEQPLVDTDCLDLKDNQAACRVAAYKNDALQSTMKLAFFITNSIFWFGVSFIFLSVVGFLSKFEPNVRSVDETEVGELS